MAASLRTPAALRERRCCDPSTHSLSHRNALSGTAARWPPWRPLVVETARRILDYTGGTLIMPMAVLVEAYWREISDGLAVYGIPVRHFVLHADPETLRQRIMGDLVIGPSTFRLAYLTPYDHAFHGWLRNEAVAIDTSAQTPSQVAFSIADSAKTS